MRFGSWTETSPLIRPRAVLSDRSRREVARRVGEDGVSVAAVARSLAVDWSTDDGSGTGVGGAAGRRRRTGVVFGRCAVSGDGRAPVEVSSGSEGRRGSVTWSRVGCWKLSRAVPGPLPGVFWRMRPPSCGQWWKS